MSGRWGQIWTVDFWGMSSAFWPAELPSDMADAVGVEPTTSGFSDQHSYHDWVTRPWLELQDGFEPTIMVLQTIAFPLGYWSLAGAKRIELISVVLETIILPLN